MLEIVNTSTSHIPRSLRDENGWNMWIHPLSSTDLTALMSAVVTLVDSLHLGGREAASPSRRHAEQVLLLRRPCGRDPTTGSGGPGFINSEG